MEFYLHSFKKSNYFSNSSSFNMDRVNILKKYSRSGIDINNFPSSKDFIFLKTKFAACCLRLKLYQPTKLNTNLKSVDNKFLSPL